MLLTELFENQLPNPQPNVWYHATTSEGWNNIQKQGYLLSIAKLTNTKTGEPYTEPRTWITNSPQFALTHGTGILLQFYRELQPEDMCYKLSKKQQQNILSGDHVATTIKTPIPLKQLKRIQ